MNFKKVNKYEPFWQLTRVNLKTERELKKKFNLLLLFLKKNKTKESYARAINWLEGLKRGYKKHSFHKVTECDKQISNLYKIYKTLPSESIKIDGPYIKNVIKTFKDEDLQLMWANLFDYEKKFTGKGYRHNDLENLTNNIHYEFNRRGLKLNFKTYKEILELRKKSKLKEKQRIFFF